MKNNNAYGGKAYRDENHTEIMVKLGIIETRLSGIDAKLAVSNGRIAQHDEIISKLASKEMFREGESKGVGFGWDIIIKIVGLIVAILTAIYGWRHF